MSTLLLLLATSAPAQPPQSVAPAIDDKQLASWVAALSDKDFAKHNAARDALVKAGPKAKPVIPDLIKLLGDKDAQVTWATLHAVDVLGAIGPDARDATPALLARVKPMFGGGYQDRLAVALAKIDGPKPEATLAMLMSSGKGTPLTLVGSEYLKSYPAAITEHLLALCKDKGPEVRQKAVIVLAGLPTGLYQPETKPLAHEVGDAGKDVPATFVKMLGDDDPAVRMTAAYGLSRVAPDQTSKTIPVVIAAMTDPKLKEKVGPFHADQIFRPIPEEAAKSVIPLFDADNSARQWAIHTMAALPVSGQLETTLKDGKTARSRQAAAVTLGHRPLSGAKSAPALKAALTDPEFIVRFAAAVSLVRVARSNAETAASVLPVLIEGLKQDDNGARLAAVQNLGSVGVPARPAVPELKQRLSDKTPEVALEAAIVLTEIASSDAAESIPVLITGVKSENEVAATRAARALSVHGLAAKSAVPELVKRFAAKTPQLRIAAAEAAGRIDPDQAEKAAEVLVTFFKQPNNSMFRDEAVYSLIRIGPSAKSAAPALVEMFQNPKKGGSDYFRVELALAIMAIDPQIAKPLATWVRERLVKDSDEDGIDIARHFRQLGVGAKPFLGELIVMLQSKDLYIRECATVTLGAIGPPAKDALPKLRELAEKDVFPSIRKYAVIAIKKIEAK